MRSTALTAVLTVCLVTAGACSDGGDDEAPAHASSRPTTSPSAAPMTGAATTTTAPGAPATTTAPPVVVAQGAPPPGPGAAAPAPTCPPVPPPATPAPDRPRYRLRADLSLERDEVVGEVSIRFTPDQPTDRVVLRLWPASPRIAAAGGRIDTGPVTVDGRGVPAERSAPTTLVVRSGPLAAGRAVEVALPWRLDLPGPVNDRVARHGDSVRLGSFFPLLAWEPGVGWAAEPPVSGFAEAATSPVADFDVTLTVPPGVTALTSGVADGPSRYRALAVRDFAVSAAPFRLAEAVARAPGDVRVTVGVAPDVAESPQAYLDKVVRVLEDFGRRLGPYPWPSLTLGITPGLGGGIEFPAHIQQGPGTLGRTTSHEVAHMWFYGLVGNNQGRDPWLDEGLASFAEARYENSLASFVGRPIPADARGRVGEPMTYWEQHQGSYYRGVYVQGAQAIAAMGEVGLVDCALRHHVARNAHRVARPGDLLDAVSVVFPDAASRVARFGVRR